MYQVAKGLDSAAERKAQRSQLTLEQLSARYLEDYAKIKNRSWQQADKLVRRFLLPQLGQLSACGIRHDDVDRMIRSIKAPVPANETLAATSAIFTWAIKKQLGGVLVHPCKGIDRNKMKSRERVL